jgi:hypothetical protein
VKAIVTLLLVRASHRKLQVLEFIYLTWGFA